MLAALRRNLRLYPWYEAATWEGISAAVWYLYLFSYKGLSLAEMAWLLLLGEGVIVLAEVPTGWFADRLGRRLSMLTGIFFQALSAVLFIFGDSFITFWLALAVCGLGDTFRSGADQALLYDSCLATNQRERFRPLYANAVFIATIVMVISEIAGGWIAVNVSWELPFWLEIGFSAFGFIAVWQMLEPPRIDRSVEAEAPSQDAPHNGRRKPGWMLWWRLMPLLAFAALIEVVPELANFHLPAELATELGLTPWHLGFMLAGFELLQGFGGKLAGHRRFSEPQRWLPWIAAGLMVCFALFSLRVWLGLAVYIIARAGIDFLFGLSGPLISEEANRRAHSAVRATALSVVNAGRRLIPLGLLPLSAFLVGRLTYAPAYLVMLAGLAIPLVLAVVWLRKLREQVLD